MRQDSNVVYIGKVKGTAYEMGYAYGQLFGDEIASVFSGLEAYGRSQVTGFLEKLGVPTSVGDMIFAQLESIGFWALDLNWQIASPYIPKRFVDELQGIADGADGKISHENIIRANMIPELIQAACSIVGAWGPATEGSRLLHLRALDWDAKAPVNQFPSVILYEPTEAGSHPFANIGFIGMIGSLTAISKIGISVGEKVMYVIDPTAYPEAPEITYYGKPWTFVLRDTVQFASNIYDVERLLQATNRTMKIHLGFGSLPDNTFRGVDYASNFVTFYDDKNYTHYTKSHNQIDGVFYYDKGIQPDGDVCLSGVLNLNHGKITPATLYQDAAGFHQTGNAQVIVMDPLSQELWASWSQYGAPVNAYERSPIHIRLNDFWTPAAEDRFLY